MADTLPIKKTPSDFLKGVLGRPVDVKLNNGVQYKGVLACLDGFMNIAMEQTQEYQNGQLKAQYGDCFIRGNNEAMAGFKNFDGTKRCQYEAFVAVKWTASSESKTLEKKCA